MPLAEQRRLFTTRWRSLIAEMATAQAEGSGEQLAALSLIV